MKNVIMSVDTGIDDAMVIYLLSKYMDIDYIIATSGNSYLNNTFNNTSFVVNSLKLNIPVYRGSEKPLIRPHFEEKYHGEYGLGDYKAENAVKKENGIIKLINSLKSDRYTILSTGPLTDIALALSVEPDISKNIEKIIIMGGAFGLNQYGVGNVNNAEFNIYYDPEAAKIVFENNVKEYVIGLDITMDPKFSMDINGFNSIKNNNIPEIIVNLSKYLISGHGRLYFHDPIAALYLINKNLFKFIGGGIKVNNDGSTTILSDNSESKYIAVDLDYSGFKTYLYDKIFDM